MLRQPELPDGYDIAAKADGDTEIRYIPGMVQQLLEDRFHLKYHRRTKEGAGYNLVVSKFGKLRKSELGDCPSPPGQQTDPPCGYLPNIPGHTQGLKLTSADLADALAFFIQAFVVDETNLPGKYDIDLQWTPDSLQPQPATPADEPTRPSIFTALQEQLGLKLESVRGPVQTLVIDHVEKASGN